MAALYDSSSLYDQSAVAYDSGDGGVKGFPTLGVFIAFESGPYDEFPLWVEVTPDVRQVTIERGRETDFEHFSTGTMRLVLENIDRKYDPFNTSSPYNGYLKPRRPVKVVANTNGVAYPIFRGYLEGFPVSWDSGSKDSVIEVDAFDLLGLLANEQIENDWSYTVINDLNPVLWYRGDDPSGIVITDSGSYKMNMRIGGQSFLQTATATEPVASAQSLATGLPYDAVFLWEGGISAERPSNVSASSSVTLSSWIQVADASGVDPFAIALTDVDYSAATFAGQLRNQIVLQTAYDYTLELSYLYAYTSGGAEAQSARSFSYVQPFHVAATYDAITQTIAIFVNGKDVTDPTTVVVGTTTSVIPPVAVEILGCAFQEFAVFDRVLTSAEIGDIYRAGASFQEETTAVRAERIMASTAIPEDRFVVETPVAATVGAFQSAGNFLELLHRNADSEGGTVFADRDGVLYILDRWYQFSNAKSQAVQAIITDAGSAPSTDLGYKGSLGVSYGADGLRNKVVVTLTGGGRVHAQRDENVDSYGRNEESLDTDLSTIVAAQELANFLVGSYSVLRPQISEIELGQGLSATKWGIVLGLDLLHRVRFQRTPSTGSALDQQMLINRISHDITPSNWTVRLQCSNRFIGWFVLDYSQLDGTDVLL